MRKYKIYIPFLEGLINQDCQACGSCCCKHGDIITLAAQDKKIFQGEHPSAKYFFLKKKNNNLYTLKIYQPCFSLDKDGLCSIQKHYGYSRKPFGCRLHPFYVARCQGEYVIIPFGCVTLSVTDKSINALGKEQVISNAIAAIGHNFFPTKIYWTSARLNLEKTILVNSRKFLCHPSYLDFAAYQLSLARRNEAMEKVKSELSDSIKLWSEFLGITVNPNNRTRAHELTAFTSMLRIGCPALNQMPPAEIPSALLALYVYAALFFNNRKIKGYLKFYEELLSDVALGLALLKKDDLHKKRKSIEYRVAYLRTLQKFYYQKARLNRETILKAGGVS